MHTHEEDLMRSTGTPYFDTVFNFSKNEQSEKIKNTEKEFAAGMHLQFIAKGHHSEMIC